jgi:hypothetical protein
MTMNGPDIFGVITGILSVFTFALALSQWASPHRRLRVIDEMMGKVCGLTVTIREEDRFFDGSDVFVRHAQRRVYMCVVVHRPRVSLWLSSCTVCVQLSQPCVFEWKLPTPPGQSLSRRGWAYYWR